MYPEWSLGAYPQIFSGAKECGHPNLNLTLIEILEINRVKEISDEFEI